MTESESSLRPETTPIFVSSTHDVGSWIGYRRFRYSVSSTGSQLARDSSLHNRNYKPRGS